MAKSGDFTGTLSAGTDIGLVNIAKGNFTGAARAGGDMKMVMAARFNGAIVSAGGNIKKVNVKGNKQAGIQGDIIDTYILAGYDVGSDCDFGVQEPGGGDLPGSGNVGGVMANGTFADSYISAGFLPYALRTSSSSNAGVPPQQDSFGSIGAVKFGDIDFDTDTDFGLFAVTDIKPVRYGRNTITQTQDHFHVDFPLV